MGVGGWAWQHSKEGTCRLTRGQTLVAGANNQQGQGGNLAEAAARIHRRGLCPANRAGPPSGAVTSSEQMRRPLPALLKTWAPQHHMHQPAAGWPWQQLLDHHLLSAVQWTAHVRPPLPAAPAAAHRTARAGPPLLPGVAAAAQYAARAGPPLLPAVAAAAHRAAVDAFLEEFPFQHMANTSQGGRRRC